MLFQKLSIFFVVSLCLLGLLQAQPVPELLYYDFQGSGTSVPNLASNPPSGTDTATILGAFTQGGSSGSCGSAALIGVGATSTSNYLNTNWAPNLGGSSWTISFRTENISGTSSLFYIFGDVNTSGWRCFTNGVAGANNWILRGPVSDITIAGGATVAPHVCTFVYNSATGNIKGYLDGVLVSTVAQGTPNITGSGPFKVGGYSSNTGLPTGGTLDNFRLYNRALSDAEVLSLNDVCAPPAAPEIVLPNGNDSITICSGTPITLSCPTANVQEYLWYKNGTAVNYQNGGTGTYTVNTTGIGTDVYELEVVYTGASALSATSAGVTVIRTGATPTIVPNGPTTFCANTPTTLNATAGMNSYVWKRSTAIVAVGSSQYTPVLSGNHSVTVTDANGCSTTSAWTNVTVNPLPTANAGADRIACLGSTVQIGGSNNVANSYAWSPTTGLSNPSISNPMASPISMTTYTVTVTNNTTGCSKTDAVLVTVNAIPPTPTISSVISGTNAVLTVSSVSASSVNWYRNGALHLSNRPANGSITVPLSNPAFAYTVRSRGANGCLSSASNFVLARNGDEKDGDLIIELDNNLMTAYPNPTSGNLQVEINNTEIGNGTLYLYNSLGQMVFSQNVELVEGSAKLSLDLTNVAAGVYSLSFEKEVVKVIKE